MNCGFSSRHTLLSRREQPGDLKVAQTGKSNSMTIGWTIYVAAVRYAFFEIVFFCCTRSFCATCCGIAGLARGKSFSC
jgi:hypothetical protein